MILAKFPKNCMKLRKFWTVGGRASGAPPLDPPLETTPTSNTDLVPTSNICKPFHFMKLNKNAFQ